jgi:endonuclease/exonuclease/phosphatase (EEP) superfamily protein YafD
LRVLPESDGTGIYSRFPLERLNAMVGTTGHVEVRARVDVPGAGPVIVQAVHTESPSLGGNGAWRSTLRQLPAATDEGLELMAGDFNATLDHEELRRILGRGWADAADRSGDGLAGTWPADQGHLPDVTLDHVLISSGIGVRSTKVLSIHNSDHHPVLAVLQLPPG